MIYVKRFLYLIWVLLSNLLVLILFIISLILSPIINIIVYLIRGRSVGLNYYIHITDWFKCLDNKLDPDN